MFNLRDYRNERITLAGSYNASQTTLDQAMTWLVQQVERLHQAFQHWRSAARQVAAAHRALGSAETDLRYANDRVVQQQQRAEEFRREGAPKRAECALEELSKLQQDVQAKTQTIADAKAELQEATAIREQIKDLLRRGQISGSLQVKLDEHLSRAEAYEEEAEY